MLETSTLGTQTQVFDPLCLPPTYLATILPDLLVTTCNTSKSHFENYVKFSPDVQLKYIFHKKYLTFETIHPKTMFPEKRE
jgi:hypothetical protein